MSAEAVLHPGTNMLTAIGYGFKHFISKLKYVDGYFIFTIPYLTVTIEWNATHDMIFVLY